MHTPFLPVCGTESTIKLKHINNSCCSTVAENQTKISINILLNKNTAIYEQML